MAGPNAPTPFHATVSVDRRTLAKKLSFNQPVTPADCSNYLFGNMSRMSVCQPVGIAIAGKYREFMLDTRNADIVMAMRNDIRNAIVQGGVLTSAGKPYEMPSWIPANIQQDIKSERLKPGVTRYPVAGDWGDIVVWKGNVSVQVYQEFPSDKAFYDRIDGNRGDGHLLHFAYTQYNKDMKFFVEERSMSPDDARSEIRRINDEVFRLILGAAASIMTSGAASANVLNAMRSSGEQVAAAVRRSPNFTAATPKRIAPPNGKLNVGGGGGPREPPGYTNLNPMKAGSGGPTISIPNHIKGTMEQMAELIEPQSVSDMISNRLRYIDVNWPRATVAAFRVMKPGGTVSMNVWCEAHEAVALKTAFERSGFQKVEIFGQSTSTIVKAIR